MVPLLQFIFRVDSVRDGALLVLSSVEQTGSHRFSSRSGVAVHKQGRPCAWGRGLVLHGGLWKNFTYFLRVARALRLEYGRYFQSSLLWQPPRDEFLLFST